MSNIIFRFYITIPMATQRKDNKYGEVYKARVWEDLRTLFQQDHLTDIMLAAEGRSIPCHRVLLAAASQFFHDKLVTNPDSLDHNLLDIEGMDFDSLATVVSFIYSGDIELTPEKALKLCPASIKLMLPELTGLCEDFLVDQMNKCDTDLAYVIDIYRMAKPNSMEDLANRSWQVMLSEFQEVTETDAFKEMSEDELTKYIKDEQLHVANEDPVFEALVNWIRHDVENRKYRFESLLKHVTLSHCSLEFLRDTVKGEPLMSMGCYEHLAEAFCLHATTVPLQPGTPRKGYTQKHAQPNTLIALCGGQWWVLKPGETFWVKHRVPHVPWTKKLQVSFRDACVMGEAIVVTGELDGRQCWKICLQTLRWVRLPDLNVARGGHATVSVGNRVYVLGGIGCDGQSLQSVEYLDEKAGAWCVFSDMPEPLHSPLGVNYNDCIYVFGGYNDGYFDNTATETFVLETVTNTWMTKTHMAKKGSCNLSLLSRQKICLHGLLNPSGYDTCSDDFGDGDTVNTYGIYFMAYDPEQDQWQTLSSNRYVRLGNCSVVWKDQVLFCGFSEFCGNGSFIEQYNPDTDTWSVWEHQLPKEAQPVKNMFALHLSNRAMRALKQQLTRQIVLGYIDDVISSVRTLYDNA